MPRTSPCRSFPLLVISCLVGVFVACGGGGGGESPTEPPMPAPAPSNASASFELSGAGYDDSIAYGSGTNLVFCRRDAGFADLWIRFAEQPSADGENGPHMDLDLCNLGDGGVFAAHHPQAASCGAGKTFDLWWHGASGDTFVNREDAAGCSLEVRRDGTNLAGTFQCLGLRELGGPGELDVLSGRFECVEE